MKLDHIELYLSEAIILAISHYYNREIQVELEHLGLRIENETRVQSSCNLFDKLLPNTVLEQLFGVHLNHAHPSGLHE